MNIHLHLCNVLFISDEFDPIQIADKLRCIADDLNDDLAFQAALNELKTAVAKEVHAQTHRHNSGPQ